MISCYDISSFMVYRSNPPNPTATAIARPLTTRNSIESSSLVCNLRTCLWVSSRLPEFSMTWLASPRFSFRGIWVAMRCCASSGLRLSLCMRRDSWVAGSLKLKQWAMSTCESYILWGKRLQKKNKNPKTKGIGLVSSWVGTRVW